MRADWEDPFWSFRKYPSTAIDVKVLYVRSRLEIGTEQTDQKILEMIAIDVSGAYVGCFDTLHILRRETAGGFVAKRTVSIAN